MGLVMMLLLSLGRRGLRSRCFRIFPASQSMSVGATEEHKTNLVSWFTMGFEVGPRDG
jgi:hypothetical protein